MTSEQRSHIDNGIWLCRNCGTLVDLDETRFNVAELRRMKREHEASRQICNDNREAEGDIIAVGPSIITVGKMIGSGPAGMRARVEHFVEGSARDLLDFSHRFDRGPREAKYVLLNELGYGGLLNEAPDVERVGHAHEIRFQLQPNIARRDATAPIATMCAETGRMLTGMEAYVQNFEMSLGMARGTWFARIKDGSDLSDLYWRYKGSPWFQRLAMMEIIRLSSIPSSEKIIPDRELSTPLACVNKVNCVTVPTFDLVGQKLELDVDFDIEGVGAWTHALPVFISTPGQLEEGRKNARKHHGNIRRMEAQYGKKPL